MKLIGYEKIDLAMLPIGDLFTMGPADSEKATQSAKQRQTNRFNPGADSHDWVTENKQ